MSYTLSEPYASVYEEYLKYEKGLVSSEGYISLKNRTRTVLKWFESENLLLEEVNIQDALRFKEYLNEKNTKDGVCISTGTMLNYLKAVKKLYRYLLSTEKIKTNPFVEITNPRLPKHISRNVLTESQMNRLLDKLKDFNSLNNPDECRNRYCCHVYSEFLYSTGLRANEAASLVLSNIDLKQRTVYVPNGKGGKSRTAYMTGYAADILKVYIENARDKIFYKTYIKQKELLFGLSSHSFEEKLNKELKSVCIELGIPVITSHGFRHSLGTHLLRAGCDIRYIQTILGHDTLESTQVYTSVYKDDLKNSIDKYHPRQFKELENNECRRSKSDRL